MLFDIKHEMLCFTATNAIYESSIRHLDSVFTNWRERVAAGKVVRRFGQRVHDLLRTSALEFNRDTRELPTKNDSLEKYTMLKRYALLVANKLQQQQALILENNAEDQFRRELLRVSSLSLAAGLPFSSSAQDRQQIISKSLAMFSESAAELENEMLSFSAKKKEHEIAARFYTISQEFSDSPAHALEEIKALEKQAQRAPSTMPSPNRNKKSVFGAAMSIVGMLRPPGFGNLQGAAVLSVFLSVYQYQ
jgi:hypothetical protein